MNLVEGVDVRSPITRLLDAASRAPAGAYLLVGPPGAGKRKAAHRLGASVVCPTGDKHPGGADSCSSCSRALRGLHPDVSIFQPEGFTFPLHLVREIVASAAQTPLEGARRVFILEEAHRIAERSQNALLKALEEPGSTVTWILVADAIEPVLPTIASRCEIAEFPSPPRVEGLDQAEGPVGGQIAGLAYRAATYPNPSGAWALGLVDELKLVADQAREIAQEEIKAELEDFEQSAGSARGLAAAKKRVADRHKRVLRRVETEVFESFLFWLGTACRDLAAASAGAGAGALVAPEMQEMLLSESKRQKPAFWLAMVEACLDGQLAIQENAGPPLIVESVVLRLCSP